ncbi:MAG: DUF4342 domain-containing protein [Clostridiales bacterium]|nr:DUF4342 domain-containing protein [Clostridiales bacterium]
MNELEKLDALKMRMQVSYSQAKEALDACEWDLVRALVYLEEHGFSQAGGWEEEDADESESMWNTEKADHFVRGIVEQVKDFIRQGNVTRVRIISGGRTLIEVPATVGVVGVGLMLFSPLLVAVAALGTAAAIVNEMVIEVEKKDGMVERHEMKFPNFPGKKDTSDSDGGKDGGEESAESGDKAGKEPVKPDLGEE